LKLLHKTSNLLILMSAYYSHCTIVFYTKEKTQNDMGQKLIIKTKHEYKCVKIIGLIHQNRKNLYILRRTINFNTRPQPRVPACPSRKLYQLGALSGNCGKSSNETKKTIRPIMVIKTQKTARHSFHLLIDVFVFSWDHMIIL